MRITLIFILCSFGSLAQKKLSLAEAWRLAEQNPSVLQKTEQTDLAAIDTELLRRLKLPVVNAQYQSLLNLGRSIDPYTNTYDTRTLLGNTCNISASYTLFDNGRIKNQIIAAENYQEALGMEKRVAENNLKYRVLLAYSEVLLVQEQINTLENQLGTTNENREYLDKLHKAGRVRYNVLLTMDAEAARLQAELQNALTEKDVAVIKLNCLINSSSELQDPVIQPVRYPFSTEQILAAAYGQLPELKALSYHRRQKKADEDFLYALRLPVISVFSNVGTTYSSAAMEIYNNELRRMSYLNQLGNNLNMNLGIGISLPLFNTVNYKHKLQRNAIEQKIVRHQELDRKQEIKGIIAEAVSRVNGVSAEYHLLTERLQGLKKLVQINQRSFEEGRGEFTEFIQARRDLEQTHFQINSLKCQYLVFFKQLEFYRKGVWE